VRGPSHAPRLAFLVALSLSFVAAAAAQTPDAGPSPTPAVAPRERPPLRVVYAGSPPFVSPGDDAGGLSIDVWTTIADRAGLTYQLTRAPSVAGALAAVARGEAEVAVGPISITAERARRLRFTQPYFQSRIGILAAERSAGVWARAAPVVTRVFAGASLALLLCLMGVGTVIWLLERRRNPDQFPSHPVPGIANGVWFALVTMTTVGYGDRAPVSVGGRVVTGFWMLVALVTTTSLTAGVASAFTVFQLGTASVQDAGDLRGRPVAVVQGTTGAAFARERGARAMAAADFTEAVAQVTDGRAIALVHDRPILQHYLASHPDSTLQLAPAAYAPQGYGFALADDDERLRRLDVALLSAHEEGVLARITQRWLGADEE